LRVKNNANTGAEWIALDMNQVQISARISAQAMNSKPFCCPEDLELMGDTLYASLTCEGATNPINIDGPGAILAVNLAKEVLKVNYFV
jgi:hypothetical protein